MKSFWQKLAKPFTVLAPMDGVTDVVFRQIINQVGRPDVFFTEFTNCDGLVSKGSEKVARSLKFKKNEKPIVVQLWGANPETFFKASQICKQLGFSGIDINMGCPDHAVMKKNAGAALICNPKLAAEIIQAVKKGGGLLVSVKTRLGEDIINLEWFEFLLKQNLSALTIHLRTTLELSKLPAHWEYLPKIIELRNRLSIDTVIIGNGDIYSRAEIEDKYKLYGCDGFMVGRAIFSNPWMFNDHIDPQKISQQEKLDLYLRHIKLYEKTWGTSKNSADLKKFSKAYVNNFSQAGSLRDKIMLCKNTKQMISVIESYKSSLSG